MKQLPTNIHLSVRRWRDMVNGNSYFSARVYADGELIARLPFQYGYGSHPQHVALEAAFPNAETRAAYLHQYCAARDIRYTEDDCGVSKRDCVAHGEDSHA